MLSIKDFFTVCAGRWQTDRTYHYPRRGEVERSYTEFNAETLTLPEKHQISSAFIPREFFKGEDTIEQSYGFGVSFETKSETGEEVAMRLTALFIPDIVLNYPEKLPKDPAAPAMPLAAVISANNEVISGFYLRDQGYSESGAITGRFTYLPSRETLEMTTYYSRSVAVDQIRLLSTDLRMRTIVTYQRPGAGEVPSEVTLVGFGLERREV
jgi:hypothetical protein